MKFLLDTYVLKEIGRAELHENVAALDTIDDSDLAASVSSVRETAKGIKKSIGPTLSRTCPPTLPTPSSPPMKVGILPVDDNIARFEPFFHSFTELHRHCALFWDSTTANVVFASLHD
ncbi:MULTISPECIES: hypothetical protein [Rhizobiaceae]|uniref:hypothetical protein n=1 Tax=Rhizobiaceae TaxID=82115 RepID=UPI000BEC9002|nr:MULTISPECIES: hypothetical protein [Rhizobiaceae]PDT33857.1 hypothetical protein CO671_22790 [Rhizobium sp. M10]